MRMYEVIVTSPDDETITLPVAAIDTFRSCLKELAPLPWEIRGFAMYDANGNVILQAGDGTRGHVVLGAVLTGVATCGGYEVEN